MFRTFIKSLEHNICYVAGLPSVFTFLVVFAPWNQGPGEFRRFVGSLLLAVLYYGHTVGMTAGSCVCLEGFYQCLRDLKTTTIDFIGFSLLGIVCALGIWAVADLWTELYSLLLRDDPVFLILLVAVLHLGLTAVLTSLLAFVGFGFLFCLKICRLVRSIADTISPLSGICRSA